ncbi:MAG: FKBP-type peptidyl-prolyl cis-trans isomerase [Saprospirales bacterium]|nr:FKBP-type peptidyl-prolyl cis-trans isomerase [Saprospirales bacterium]
MKKFLLLLFPIMLLLGACTKDPLKQLENDTDTIQNYLDDNGLTAESTASGLHYIIEVEGTGGHPSLSDEVTVFYKGYDLKGEVFDETGADPVSFPLANVIQGWREGIPLFQKGGRGILLILSALAYGSYPPPGIKKNAVLIFQVELVDF